MDNKTMDYKDLYEFLFKMFDFADYLVEEIEINNSDNNIYFMSLIYIEDMMDKYGRHLINKTAHQIDEGDSASIKEANKRIAELRDKITRIRDEYNLNDIIPAKSQEIPRNWHKNI